MPKRNGLSGGYAEAVISSDASGGYGHPVAPKPSYPHPIRSKAKWPVLDLRVAKTNGPSEMLRPKLPGKAFLRSADPHSLLDSKSGLIWKKERPISASTKHPVIPRDAGVLGRLLAGMFRTLG